MSETSDDHRLRWALRGLLIALGLCLGLAGVVGFLLSREARPGWDPVEVAKLDPGVREEAVLRLIEGNLGFWDSFPDPEVGRVLLPKQEGKLAKETVQSNSYGLREKEFSLIKPPGTVRVVLLGDSYVFGSGVEAKDRIGVFLEAMLSERADKDAVVECLHFGLYSWNILAECAFLRRQLSLLQPDLVIQIVVGNDLDDCASVRGMGLPASFSSYRRSRADAIIARSFPQQAFLSRERSWLIHGLDWESRQRYAEAADRMQQLAASVAQAGGKYLVASYWPNEVAAVARKQLLHHFADEQVLYLSSKKFRDSRYRISANDAHWNAAGCERLARLLFGVIVERELLPRLSLESWPEAVDFAVEVARAGRRAADQDPTSDFEAKIGTEIDFHQLSESSKVQVNGGVDAKGQVSPYASMILRVAGGTTLLVEGRGLGRLELNGAEVKVWLDEHKLGQWKLEDDEAISWSVELPAELRRRTYVSLRFESSDFAYDEGNLRHCISFELDRVAIQ